MENNIIRVEEKVSHLEKVCERQQKDLEDVCDSIKSLRTTTDGFIRDIHRDIAAIRVEMAKPSGVSWATMIVINMLAVVTTGLIVYLATASRVL